MRLTTTVWLTMLVLLGGFSASYVSGAEATMFKTQIHREGDRVWLDGVSCWTTGNAESSVQAGQAAIMQALGQPVTYDYLLGVSGLAFRLQISKDGMCGSSPHACCGFPCADQSVAALPWQVRHYGVAADEPDKVREVRQAVMASIDRGVPVQYGSEEDGLIIGYQKNGEEWLCLHPYQDQGKKTFVEKEWPWGITIYTAPKDTPPDRRSLVIASLRQAVTMATTKEADAYHLGYAAWDDYLWKLKTLETADAATRKASLHGNSWIYECLAQYRGSAARYLREVAGDFSPAVAEHLHIAANLYDQMANQVLCDETHRETVSIAPYPWMLKRNEEWTPAQIHDQIQRLERALPLEHQAIVELQLALASL